MSGFIINELILEKLQIVVNGDDIRNFVTDILKIEQESITSRTKIKDYEKALAKYVGTE